MWGMKASSGPRDSEVAETYPSSIILYQQMFVRARGYERATHDTESIASEEKSARRSQIDSRRPTQLADDPDRVYPLRLIGKGKRKGRGGRGSLGWRGRRKRSGEDFGSLGVVLR
jgi:hypothetical protein